MRLRSQEHFYSSSPSFFSGVAYSNIGTQPDIDTQREHYLNAIKQFKNRQYTRYYHTKDSLHNYPLRPYLDYQEIKSKLRSLPFKRVDAFLTENSDSYLAKRLRRQWLNTLADQRRWNDFLRYWSPSVANTSLHCDRLMAFTTQGKRNRHCNIPRLSGCQGNPNRPPVTLSLKSG